jgi:inhibitor of cysteine peptidase
MRQGYTSQREAAMTKGPFYIACIISIYIACFFTAQIAVMPSAAVAACSCQARQRAIPEEQKEDDGQGSPIHARAGEIFSITLDSNPTTGYQWKLANPLDEKALKLISSEYRMPETQMVGTGGKEAWTFKALSMGQATISFEYVRPWEKDREPAKKAIFKINIQ